MLKVGITGGIGSGKTTVCQIFATLGVPIYYADTRAKELMISDADVIQQLKILLVMMLTMKMVS
jgi:dephospho-CoA kinase